jgi:hypothetical protein
LASAARLLRRVHDATTTWTPPPNAEWGAPAVAAQNGEDLVYCHGRPGAMELRLARQRGHRVDRLGLPSSRAPTLRHRLRPPVVRPAALRRVRTRMASLSRDPRPPTPHPSLPRRLRRPARLRRR